MQSVRRSRDSVERHTRDSQKPRVVKAGGCLLPALANSQGMHGYYQ